MRTGHRPSQAAQGLERSTGTCATQSGTTHTLHSAAAGATRTVVGAFKRATWGTSSALSVATRGRILTLSLDFVFDAPGDCNLNMVRELLANWMPKERSNQVKVRCQIFVFAPMTLNRLLGTPNVDPQPFVDMLRMNGVTEEQLQQLNIDYPLSEHLRALCRVGPGYEEPLDDDVATEDDMERVESDIEFSDDEEDDSEMGKLLLPPQTTRKVKINGERTRAVHCLPTRLVARHGSTLALQAARSSNNNGARRDAAAADQPENLKQ
ncbi:hypothetical protein HAX54_019680 [Datura stramonium]|uniref:Uncharacterized protein n=1 Tax=Datura stramonium TaxID=4076 RepID=A0ABS8USH1_DATST|nr:hypothetical protein [Datura stramonium]